MIVISGALVLVALVLLVIGLVSTSLPFVYASIAVSVVSFVFLLLGILQRRREPLPVEQGGTAGSEPEESSVTTVVPPAEPAEPAELAEPAEPSEPAERTEAAEPVQPAERAPAAGSVLVVPGRPRYHVEGCRYLSGRQADEVEITAARADGFTACGVCRPDDVLAEEATAEPHPQPEADTVPAPVVAARRTTRATPATSPGRTPARTAVRMPAPAAETRTAPARRNAVVVIPDRGRFHRPDCRYVRGADNAQEMTKAQAAKQGYAPCGVCQP